MEVRCCRKAISSLCKIRNRGVFKKVAKVYWGGACTVRNGTKDDEGDRLLKGSEGSYRIVFDERGNSIDTQEFTQKVNDLEMNGEVNSFPFLSEGLKGIPTR